jgi:glycosyltransferase involved in cell wall biosynthesis
MIPDSDSVRPPSLNELTAIPASVAVASKRMLVLCPFPEGIAPAQRLKYEQYFDHWRENGYEITVCPFMHMDLFRIAWKNDHLIRKIYGTVLSLLRRLADIARTPKYDLIYVFMWVTPLGSTWPERLVRRFAKSLIYDIDDNTHIGQNLPAEHNPNRLIQFLKNRNKPLYLMRNADFVITSSPFLNDEAMRINKKRASAYITSSVDTEYFVPRGEHRPYSKIVIGWTGTFSSKPFLDLLAVPLRKLRELRDFEFRIIGNFDYVMEGVDVKVVQFDKSREIEDLYAFDIGVYPLPQDPWVLGKSGLKAIVYMAMGLPVVASKVGTTPLLFSHEEIGFMASSDEEWIDALTCLIDDPGQRKAMGEAARRVVVRNYSHAAVRSEYLAVLDRVTS